LQLREDGEETAFCPRTAALLHDGDEGRNHLLCLFVDVNDNFVLPAADLLTPRVRPGADGRTRLWIRASAILRKERVREWNPRNFRVIGDTNKRAGMLPFRRTNLPVPVAERHFVVEKRMGVHCCCYRSDSALHCPESHPSR